MTGMVKGPIAAGVRSITFLPSFCRMALLLDVRAGRGRVEHDLDVLVVRQLAQALDALVGRRHVEARGARETVGVRIDADHRAHLEVSSTCA